MGQIFGTLAFAILGALMIHRGVSAMRDGFEISAENKLEGPGATAIGLTMIALGVALPIAAFIYLGMK